MLDQSHKVHMALLALIIASAIGFFCYGGYKLLMFYSLDDKAFVREVEFSTKERRSNRYHISAHYTYDVSGQEYHGDSMIKKHFTAINGL